VAANSVAIDALQSRIQHLDMELASDAAVQSDPDRAQELWSQRVKPAQFAFGVRYAEAVHAGYRCTIIGCDHSHEWHGNRRCTASA